jgi:P-type Ca2+ transporter type 2C
VGDAIPADLRLLKISSALLKIDEALLTGEGKDVKKTTAQLDLEEDAPKYKKANILFSSTIMMYGRGLAVVCFTGVHTEVGKIQILVKEAQENEVESPLKKRLNQFGELLSKIIGIICFLVWAMNITNFNDPMHGHWFRGCIYYLKIAISLAVAAIPEGLPAVITTCLALGTRKMAANNAIVRKLLSVETLGCTTIICSDKTGTLTRNEMTVTKMFLIGDGIEIRNVKGNGLEPKGAIQGAGARSAKTGTALKEMAKICALCNNSTIRYEDDKYKRLGEATEAALKVLAEKIGKYDPEFKENYDIIYAEQYTEFLQKEMTTLQMLEFSRERKCMSALIHEAHNGNILLTKGAPERLLDSCKTLMHENGTIMPLTKELKDIIKEKILQLSKNALRCIGFSIKTDLGSLSSLRTQEEANEHLNNPEEFSEIECGGTFIGVAGMMDPARGEVPKAIKQCKTAGISVVMITGDNQDTANAIARDIGILPKDLKDIYNYSFSGQQFEKLEKEEQQKAIRRKGGKVFARVEPKHKQDLVKLFIEAGHIVAMTGDGVNDAAALEQAHIGIAMGVNGTDVAKEASDMVLADDNFATIVMAVEEGRSIYSNTKAFIRYLISSNIGEVASIFITALLGMPEGLNSVQLLWVI